VNCPCCCALSVALGMKEGISIADVNGLAVSVVAHCRMGDADLCETHRTAVVSMIAQLRRHRIAKEGT
jgi:hypothetical protein